MARLPGGRTYKQELLSEPGDSLDLNRVHFLGKVPYSVFLKVLQASCVHAYLTYPFVLSWSMLEAMSAGCVIAGSKTQPVEEVVRRGENGLLVDFFARADRGSSGRCVKAATIALLAAAQCASNHCESLRSTDDMSACVFSVIIQIHSEINLTFT